MDPNKDIEELQAASYAASDEDDGTSVDDFIKQLEAKEKDLHITSDTSVIEIAEAFDDGGIPEGLREALDRATGSPETPVETLASEDKGIALRLENEIESLKATIAKMGADQDEMFKNSQRRARDFENFKARSERERRETFQNQIGNLAMLMLPALDNLHRALESAEHFPGEKSPAFKQFYEGIVLVNEQISDILVKMGIRAVRSLGEEFDPHFHEAVATEETDAYPPNTICGELLRGYVAGDRVIRHSMVKVAKAPVSIPPLAADDPDDSPECGSNVEQAS